MPKSWMIRGTMVLATLFAIPAFAADWPQWAGVNRDSVWPETGIVKTFPPGGPPIIWRAPIAGGYAGPAVAQDRVFVSDFLRTSGEAKNDPNQRAELIGKERVHCLDARTGKVNWTFAYDCTYDISFPAGPRATPTVDQDRVYVLGAQGHLHCLDVASGKVIWAKNFVQDYHAPTPIWGFCSHPLVDGDRLICLVGGEGSIAVAFDKMTGKEIWRALNAPDAGYSPPTIITAGGVRQLVIWHPKSLQGLEPESGKTYWSVPLEPDYGMSINPPRTDGSYLFAGGIMNKAVLLKLSPDRPAVTEVWRAKADVGINPVHSPPFFENGVMYGVDRGGELTAVELPSGKHLWTTYAPTSGERRANSATAFLVKNENRFFLMSESGELIIAQLSPKGYEEVGRAKLLEPTHEAFGRPVVWSHPAFANKCVFARNDKEIICASLAAD